VARSCDRPEGRRGVVAEGTAAASARCSRTPPTSSTLPPTTSRSAPSRSRLADELVRGSLLGAAGVVCHVGNDPAADPASAARRVADSLLGAFELAGDAGSSARLLLENTAGAGRTFGSTFEQLWSVHRRRRTTERTLCVCLDTCHAFAFGMALDTPEAWRDVVDGIGTLCWRRPPRADPRQTTASSNAVRAETGTLGSATVSSARRVPGDGVRAGARIGSGVCRDGARRADKGLGERRAAQEPARYVRLITGPAGNRAHAVARADARLYDRADRPRMGRLFWRRPERGTRWASS